MGTFELFLCYHLYKICDLNIEITKLKNFTFDSHKLTVISEKILSVYKYHHDVLLTSCWIYYYFLNRKLNEKIYYAQCDFVH